LQLFDQVWKEHLLTLDHLRQGIGLRAYGQRDPLNEYKREAFDLFSTMLETLRERVTQLLAQVELEISTERDPATLGEPAGDAPRGQETRVDPAMAPAPAQPLGPRGSDTAYTDDNLKRHADADGTVHVKTRFPKGKAERIIDPDNPKTWGRVARNAQCPCGSGRKYKHCHGKMG
jgi:preprotein translocase subunit SecA